MKKLILFLAGLLLSVNAHATSITMPYCNTQTGGFIFASQWNANCSAVQSFLNNQNIDGTTNIATGGIQTGNIANLAVTDAKIAGITTAGKVNGSSLTSLGSIPSGGGAVPLDNLPTGVKANTLVYQNSSGNVGIGTTTVSQLLTVGGETQTNTLAVTGSFYNYGTSGSSSSFVTGTIKIAFGNLTAGTAGATVTNLPFTSTSTYICTATNSSGGSVTYAQIAINSASQISINSSSTTTTYNWICIGS